MISSLYIGLVSISCLALSRLISPPSIVRTLSAISDNKPSNCITRGISTKLTTEWTSSNLFISSLSCVIFVKTVWVKRFSLGVNVTNKNSLVA